MSSLKEKLKDQIVQGKLDQAIQTLLENSKNDSDFHNQVVHLSSRYASLKQEKLQGILSSANSNLQQNQITNALLALINQLPDESTASGDLTTRSHTTTEKITPSDDPKNTPWKKWVVIAGGIIAALAGIAEISGYSLRDLFSSSSSSEALTLTVKVRAENGTRPLKGAGSLAIDYGNGTQTVEIDKEGKIDLRELPARLKGNKVSIILEHSKYEGVTPPAQQKYILDGNPIEYFIRPSIKRGLIKGMVRDETTLAPIDSAAITIGTDTTIYSAPDGRFQVNLPDRMQKDNYELVIRAAAYQLKRQPHSPYSTDADIRLKK
ncbi:MAG: hypothetical protein AAF573_01050 [Bacteroidota bacterium]